MERRHIYIEYLYSVAICDFHANFLQMSQQNSVVPKYDTVYTTLLFLFHFPQWLFIAKRVHVSDTIMQSNSEIVT